MFTGVGECKCDLDSTEVLKTLQQHDSGLLKVQTFVLLGSTVFFF